MSKHYRCGSVVPASQNDTTRHHIMLQHNAVTDKRFAGTRSLVRPQVSSSLAPQHAITHNAYVENVYLSCTIVCHAGVHGVQIMSVLWMCRCGQAKDRYEITVAQTIVIVYICSIFYCILRLIRPKRKSPSNPKTLQNPDCDCIDSSSVTCQCALYKKLRSYSTNTCYFCNIILSDASVRDPECF